MYSGIEDVEIKYNIAIICTISASTPKGNTMDLLEMRKGYNERIESVHSPWLLQAVEADVLLIEEEEDGGRDQEIATGILSLFCFALWCF